MNVVEPSPSGERGVVAIATEIKLNCSTSMMTLDDVIKEGHRKVGNVILQFGPLEIENLSVSSCFLKSGVKMEVVSR